MSEPFGHPIHHGGDEWILVELSEAMSLGVNMRAQAITTRLASENLDGMLDICCSNASYLVRVDPDVLHPRAAVEHLRALESDVGDAAEFRLQTKVVEVPILWEDEWTLAVLKRFRDRHQTPDKTDIEFAAELNGFDTVDAFKESVCSTPFMATHDRVRSRAGVVVSAHHPRQADRGAQVRAPAH